MKKVVIIHTPETDLEVRAEVDSINNIYFKPIKLPCGGTAFLSGANGIGYHCKDCGGMVGGRDQPQDCVKEFEKWKTWESLGGKGWDYFDKL
jgi:hypothetical protein